MIGLIIAMEKEAKEVMCNLTDCKIIEHAKQKYYCGYINNVKIVLAICGIGKVNAAVATQNLISVFKATQILNVGTCGGLVERIKVGKCYSVYKCYQQDFDLSELDDVEIGYMQDFNFKYFVTSILKNKEYENAVLATADSFSINKKSINKFIICGAELRDMEGCAIAQTCYLNNVQCYIQKIVTDVSYATQTMGEQYYNAVKNSSKLIFDIVTKSLKLM